MAPPVPSFVYFMRPIGHAGPVKIGCSAHPDQRLATYMAWSPLPLEIAATVLGDQKLERRFHAFLRQSHSHHEWFHPTDDVLSTLDLVAAGAFDFSLLPEKGWLSGQPERKGRKWSDVTRLRFRLHRAFRAAGYSDVGLADVLRGWDRIDAEARESAAAIIEAAIAAPHERGLPIPTAWAAKARAAYAAAHGLPPTLAAA